MDKLIIGAIVGLVALGLTFVANVDVNLPSFALGYVAGVVAVMAIEKNKSASISTERELTKDRSTFKNDGASQL